MDPVESRANREDPRLKASEFIEASLEAVHRMDASALWNELRSASISLSRPCLLTDVVAPFMQMIGDEWADGSLKIIHEHLASSVVKGFLWDSLGSTRVYDPAPLMVLTTPAGQHCEIGALMAAVTAADAGWKIFYCGPDLPAEEIAAAAEAVQVADVERLVVQAVTVAVGVVVVQVVDLVDVVRHVVVAEVRDAVLRPILGGTMRRIDCPIISSGV